MGNSPVISVTFIAYLVIIVGLSVYAAKMYVKDVGDFFLGGRRVGVWGTALSAMATGRSASSMIGHAGMAYLLGIHAHWVSLGFVLTDFIGLKWFAPRMRRYAGAKDCITVPDYFEARFHDKTHTLRILSLMILLIFMVGYVAAQVMGVGLTFRAILGWEPLLGIAVAAAVTTIYCFMGGYLAEVWSDVVQAILMLFAMLVLPFAGLIAVGGPAELFAKLQAIDPKLTQILPAGKFPWAMGMLIGTGLVQWGFAHTILRWMSVSDPKELETAAPINFIANTIVAFGGMLIGWVGRVMFPDVNMLIDSNREMVFFNLALATMPAFVVGLIASGVLASMMSSVDSQLIVASSAVVRDLFQKVIMAGKEVKTETLLWISRLSVVVIMIGAFFWAYTSKEGVFWLVFYATAGLGGGIGSILILSLFWKRVNFWGAVAGMISGPMIAYLWKSNAMLRDWMFEGLPAVVGAALIVIVVSLLTKKPNEDEVEEDFKLLDGAE